MPNRRAWVYNPHSGGKKVPDHVRRSTERRITEFAAEHYAGRYRELAIRFHGQFCYVDAFVDPEPLPAGRSGPGGETAEEYHARLRDIPPHLCRLRFNGDADRWTFAFYGYSSETYEPSAFMSGSNHGTPEEAFDLSAGAYLT